MFETILELHAQAISQSCERLACTPPSDQHLVRTILPYFDDCDYSLLVHGRHPFWSSKGLGSMKGARNRIGTHPAMYKVRVNNTISEHVIEGDVVDWDGMVHRRNTVSLNFRVVSEMRKLSVSQDIVLLTDPLILEAIHRIFAGVSAIVSAPTHSHTEANDDGTFNLSLSWDNTQRLREMVDYLGMRKLRSELDKVLIELSGGHTITSTTDIAESNPLQIKLHNLSGDAYFNALNYAYAKVNANANTN